MVIFLGWTDISQVCGIGSLPRIRRKISSMHFRLDWLGSSLPGVRGDWFSSRCWLVLWRGEPDISNKKTHPGKFIGPLGKLRSQQSWWTGRWLVPIFGPGLHVHRPAGKRRTNSKRARGATAGILRIPSLSRQILTWADVCFDTEFLVGRKHRVYACSWQVVSCAQGNLLGTKKWLMIPRV